MSAQRTPVITGQDDYPILQIIVDGSIDPFDLPVDATTGHPSTSKPSSRRETGSPMPISPSVLRPR
ncbi:MULTISPECIES: hypothetical protein [unclassified Rhodococcus (in: high G+C Gram-positive bacteria)]|uniref:hypothetical protein n=1 Tax=unclassified Rhodococcus (in: high G+C Gram-positive bacteria) TaxID=192944 RepID=UPI00113FEAAF|nr:MULTISPECIES: hypothetical protein [unclassified Rhodococcus (in: high G+C Gram-positive bacteria)]